MAKAVIVKMGFAGGGVTIYGCQTDGVWSFWQEGGSIYIDDNDEEDWRYWSSDPVSELSELLPKEWWMLSPIEVYPEFVAPLRREYERCLGAGGGSVPRFRHERWRRLLSIPDLESDSATDSEDR